MSELHLFIIWKNALYKKDEILNDIKLNFDIMDIYEVNWSRSEYSNNLSRFYGTSLPQGSYKEVHCGKGVFLLITVRDNNPKYEIRKTTHGDDLVNINMFDKKTNYRKITGGGHKIHATNSVAETDHDLTLIMGKNSYDYLKGHDFLWDGKIKHIKNDLIGSKGFNNIDEMFYVLNNCTDYAILRNYENLPNEIYVNEHNDIDIICDNKENVAYALNAKKAQNEEYRVQYFVNVEGKTANFDLRYIGDRYYDYKIENDILKTRIFNKKGFYTLSNENYFYTLLYHALIHKREFSNDYIRRLKILNIQKHNFSDKEELRKILEKWMLKNEYIIEKPNDLSVFFNTRNLENMSRLIYRQNNKEYELEEKIIELNEKLNAINYSRTWRYTKIIRNINSKLKAFKLNNYISKK